LKTPGALEKTRPNQQFSPEGNAGPRIPEPERGRAKPRGIEREATHHRPSVSPWSPPPAERSAGVLRAGGCGRVGGGGEEELEVPER
jgi:hypothetical protein